MSHGAPSGAVAPPIPARRLELISFRAVSWQLVPVDKGKCAPLSICSTAEAKEFMTSLSEDKRDSHSVTEIPAFAGATLVCESESACALMLPALEGVLVEVRPSTRGLLPLRAREGGAPSALERFLAIARSPPRSSRGTSPAGRRRRPGASR